MRRAANLAESFALGAHWWCSIADVDARCGDSRRVEAIARKIRGVADQFGSVSPAATQLALGGHHDSAARVLASAWLREDWTAPLAALVHVDAGARQTRSWPQLKLRSSRGDPRASSRVTARPRR